MDISCAFASSPDTPDHIALAEQLGYRRAWCYDSPALYPDVWVTLALAAQRTSHIALGPGVLVPSLRHVMTNAAAIATLEHLAPGRLVVAIGSGFTGRVAMGQRSLSWSRVRTYIAALRALLRGETATWDGAVIKMLHPPGFAPSRPIAVPILVGADGPKGAAVAEVLGDGIFGRARAPGISWYAQLHFGTVLDDGEDPASERVMAAAFANFVKTGNPNGPGVPPWPEFGKTRQVMVLDAPSKAVPEPDRARYEFIDGYVVK